MKSLLSSLKAIKDKVVTTIKNTKFSLLGASAILFVWTYSLILSAMFPDYSLFNLIVQFVLVLVFVVLVIRQYFKDAKWLPRTHESFKPTFPTPAIVHVPVILPPPMEAVAKYASNKPEASAKKKAVRKPRRTKAEIEKAKMIKEEKRKMAAAIVKKVSN